MHKFTSRIIRGSTIIWHFLSIYYKKRSAEFCGPFSTNFLSFLFNQIPRLMLQLPHPMQFYYEYLKTQNVICFHQLFFCDAQISPCNSRIGMVEQLAQLHKWQFSIWTRTNEDLTSKTFPQRMSGAVLDFKIILLFQIFQNDI